MGIVKGKLQVRENDFEVNKDVWVRLLRVKYKRGNTNEIGKRENVKMDVCCGQVEWNQECMSMYIRI